MSTEDVRSAIMLSHVGRCSHQPEAEPFSAAVAARSGADQALLVLGFAQSACARQRHPGECTYSDGTTYA